jgi:uracil-DNA glycosylase
MPLSTQVPLPKTLSQLPTPAPDLDSIRDSIIACNLCPRLRDYCTGIGNTRRRAYQDEEYWARPVPGFGDPRARVLILGLAPGAHGANRTGRPFTGDGSGDFMYPVLHELGFATKPRGISRDDGLRLSNAWIASVVRCAPPGDKPTPQEIRISPPRSARSPASASSSASARSPGTASSRISCSPASSAAGPTTPSPTPPNTSSPTACTSSAATIPRCATPTPAGSIAPCSPASSSAPGNSRASAEA